MKNILIFDNDYSMNFSATEIWIYIIGIFASDTMPA